MDYLAQALAENEYVQDMYRSFHSCPEPSRREFQTHARIRRALDADGIRYFAPEQNITIAVIEGAHPGRICAIRADTDALQLTERTGLAYASQNEGLMHACGHDAHIACALLAARLLSRHSDSLAGCVKIIFQPAEEGEFGARAVINTKLVDDVNAFFGLHVWSPFPAGDLRVSPHGVAASTDMFTLNISGVGGHGATPEKCVDTVVCASALVMALQTISSRLVSPFTPVVVTVGSLRAGTRCNIIAGEAVLEGTIRVLDPDVYKAVHAHFKRIVESVCQTHGCTYTIDMRHACGVTYNDEHLTELALKCAYEIAPADKVGADEPSMLGDDFADYREIAPICYVKVGVRNEAIGACHAHHSEYFRIDESALSPASAWLCKMVDAFLRGCK